MSRGLSYEVASRSASQASVRGRVLLAYRFGIVELARFETRHGGRVASLSEFDPMRHLVASRYARAWMLLAAYAPSRFPWFVEDWLSVAHLTAGQLFSPPALPAARDLAAMRRLGHAWGFGPEVEAQLLAAELRSIVLEPCVRSLAPHGL